MTTDQQISNAIQNKNLIDFTYDGLQRIAEPHILGIKNNVVQLLIYQTGGQSRSGAIPNWRRIDVSKMNNLTVLDSIFPGKRPTPTGKHTEWDAVIKLVE